MKEWKLWWKKYIWTLYPSSNPCDFSTTGMWVIQLIYDLKVSLSCLANRFTHFWPNMSSACINELFEKTSEEKSNLFEFGKNWIIQYDSVLLFWTLELFRTCTRKTYEPKFPNFCCGKIQNGFEDRKIKLR